MSKGIVFVSSTKSVYVEEVAQIFGAHVFSKFGMPENLTLDRYSKITETYWKTLGMSSI